MVGKHVMANCYGIRDDVTEEELVRVVVESAELANMTLVEVRSWSFEGEKGGVSVIALVVESHIAVHTWSKHRYATVDVYTCGADSDPWVAAKKIIEYLRPERVVFSYRDRSYREEAVRSAG